MRPATLDWLADYRFGGDIWGYREGEAYFPGSPLLTIQATFAEAVMLETLVLSTLNYDSSVASAAARMVSVALGRPIAEMGSRRTSERAAVAAARAAYIAGFDATSQPRGRAHLGHPDHGHRRARVHPAARHRGGRVPRPGRRVRREDHPARRHLRHPTRRRDAPVEVAGTELGAVRIDSGDLPTVVAAVREQLDALGAVDTKITVTSDLDEFTIAGALGLARSTPTGSAPRS